MSNMSYCRFQNTANDLDACQGALEDLLRGEAEPLSREELVAAKRLVQTCIDVVALMGGEVDTDDLDDIERSASAALDIANREAQT